MVGATLVNLLSRRLDRTFLKYLAETFATWGTYAVLWAITYGGVTQNLVGWCLMWTLVATVLASLLVRADPGDGDGAPTLGPTPDDTRQELPPASDGSWLERVRHVRAAWPVVARRWAET